MIDLISKIYFSFIRIYINYAKLRTPYEIARKERCKSSLFVDDLKMHKKSYKSLKHISEVIVQLSNDTGACMLKSS